MFCISILGDIFNLAIMISVELLYLVVFSGLFKINFTLASDDAMTYICIIPCVIDYIQ